MISPKSSSFKKQTLINLYSENISSENLHDLSNNHFEGLHQDHLQSSKSLNNKQDKDANDSIWLALIDHIKQLLIQCSNHFSPKPTPFTLICGSTLYLIAIFSSIQRQEGNRSFDVLINVKIPGRGPLYQKTSWQSFENVLSNYTNSHIRKRDGSLKADSLSNASLIHSIDLFKDEAIIRFKSPWEKQVRKQFLGVFTANNNTTNSLPNSFYIENIRDHNINKSDLNKNSRNYIPAQRGLKTRLGLDEAYSATQFEHSRPNPPTVTPLVGQLPLRGSPGPGSEWASNSSPQVAMLPWYQIDACNEPSRASFANWSQIDVDNLINTVSLTPDQTGSTKLGFVRENMAASQYFLPFHASKESVYVESDSIPTRMDSPYSYRKVSSNLAQAENQSTLMFANSFVERPTPDSPLTNTLNIVPRQTSETESQLPEQGSASGYLNGSPLKGLAPNGLQLQELKTETGQCFESEIDPLALIEVSPQESKVDEVVSQTGVKQPEDDSTFSVSEDEEEELPDSAKLTIEEDFKEKSLFQNNRKASLGRHVTLFEDGVKDLFYYNGLSFPQYLVDFSKIFDPAPSKDKAKSKNSKSSTTTSSSVNKTDTLGKIDDSNESKLKESTLNLDSDLDEALFIESILMSQVINYYSKLQSSTENNQISSFETTLKNSSEGVEADSPLEGVEGSGYNRSSHDRSSFIFGADLTPLRGAEEELAYEKQDGETVSNLKGTLLNLLYKKYKLELFKEFKGKQTQVKQDLNSVDPHPGSGFRMGFRDGVGGTPLRGVQNGLLEAEHSSGNRNFVPEQASASEEVSDSAFNKEHILSMEYLKHNLFSTRFMSGYKFADLSKSETSNLFRQFVLKRFLCFPSLVLSTTHLADQLAVTPLSIALPPALSISVFKDLLFSSSANRSTSVNPSLNQRLMSFSSSNRSTIVDHSSNANYLKTTFKASQNGNSYAKQLESSLAQNLTQQFAPEQSLVPSKGSDSTFVEMEEAATLLPLAQDSDMFATTGGIEQPSTSMIKASLGLSEHSSALNSVQTASPCYAEVDRDTSSHISNTLQAPKGNFKYRILQLEEVEEVKRLFAKLGQDYSEYLNLPKESPAAIDISPSLEDDKALQLKAETDKAAKDAQEEESIEETLTEWEILQNIREEEENTELGKKLKRFAYDKKVAVHFDSESFDFPNPSKSNLATWIESHLGYQNMLSDRKQSFLGQMNVLPKKLVGTDQKEINDQILTSSATRSEWKSSESPSLNYHQDNSEPKLKNKDTEFKTFLLINRKPLVGHFELIGHSQVEAGDMRASAYRKRRPEVALRKIFNTNDEYNQWQNKTVEVSNLGSTSRPHLVMPEISIDEWRRMLEWQLKKYFFEETNRLKPLVRKNPHKHFKIRRINLYLPWVVVKTPLNKSFEWPLTRLDYSQTSFAPLSTVFGIASKKTIPLPEPESYSSSGDPNPVQLSTTGNSLPSTHLNKQQFPPKVDTGYLSSPIHNNGLAKTNIFRSPLYEPVEYLYTPKIKRKGKRLAIKNKGVASLDKGNSFGFGQKKTKEREYFIFEPITNQSYLFIYRLLVIFVLKDVFKYLNRVSLKQFLISMVNTDFGRTVTSPEYREWLQCPPPKEFYRPNKRLKDVSFAEESVPAISDIIWFLRNLGRDRTAPRGLLLVGSPGTEKTSLVQAIAGEAQVAVIVQSMSALNVTSDQPYETLEKLFLLARKQAPCILFLDDLEAIGKSREDFVKDEIGADDSLLCLESTFGDAKARFNSVISSLHTPLLPKTFHSLPSTSAEKTQQKASGGNLRFAQQVIDSDRTRVNLMLRLLTEMDSIRVKTGVIVVATAQQPSILDPALLRPGRFERKLHLRMPNHKTRIALFKVKTEKLGHENQMPWHYLATRTSNMSVADIAAAINHSAIRAILDQTVHTVETLDHGLNCVTGLPNLKYSSRAILGTDPFRRLSQSGVFHEIRRLNRERDPGLYLRKLKQVKGIRGAKDLNSVPESSFGAELHLPEQSSDSDNLNPVQVQATTCTFERDSRFVTLKQIITSTQKCRDPFDTTRSAFYQASKALVQELLPNHPTLPFYTLDLQTTEPISTLDLSLLATQAEEPLARTRIDLETRLIALYGGKAGELLHISLSRFLFPGTKDVDKNIPLRPFHKSEESVHTAQLSVVSHEPLNKRSMLHSVPFTEDSKTLRVGAWLFQSNIGLPDLLIASSLIHLMVDRWNLYSKHLFALKTNKLVPSLNHKQTQIHHLLPLLNQLSQQIESDNYKVGNLPYTQGLSTHSTLSAQEDAQLNESLDILPSLTEKIDQQQERTAWWQDKMYREIQMSQRPYGKWFRIYISKIEQRKRNKEWIPPDTIFHQLFTNGFGGDKRAVEKSGISLLKTWNDLYLLERDSSYQSAIINCFYSAFNLLSENREMLDMLADHLIRFHKVRSYEIVRLCSSDVKSSYIK